MRLAEETFSIPSEGCTNKESRKQLSNDPQL